MDLVRSICTGVFLLLALPVSGQQRADSTSASDQTQPPAMAPSGSVKPAIAPRVKAAAPDTLDQMRGGSDAVADGVAGNLASDTQLQGTTDHNNATNVVTGNNTIQSSFASAAGIPVVIQNSGANVLIQNATVVNLQFK